MCDLDSASVVEDHGGFQSINTAAHELGHRYTCRRHTLHCLSDFVHKYLKLKSQSRRFKCAGRKYICMVINVFFAYRIRNVLDI